MDSFEDLGVAPELVEALAAEGIESPTPLQEAAIPVLRRGNNLVLGAGPGSGLLVAWVTGLLERVPAEGGVGVLALTRDGDTAERLAESVARLTQATGHTVAALGSHWVLPQRARLLFGSPREVLIAKESGELDTEGVEAVVFVDAHLFEDVALSDVERLIAFLPDSAQRVLTALPLTPNAADLASRHVKRATTVPTPLDTVAGPKRGTVRFRIVPEPREPSILEVVDELLKSGARHVLVFCRTEDRAADVGDLLALHGYGAGVPGDADVPVWLGVDALEARAAGRAAEDVIVLSCEVPSDPDSLDRRHSITDSGVVLVLPREVAHLRDLAKRTGYTVVPFPPTAAAQSPDPFDAVRRSLTAAIEGEDIPAYLVALAPLFETHDPAEVAAAAVALLRKKIGPTIQVPATRTDDRGGGAPSWAKLFITVGRRDELEPGDLLGAITGEAGVPGDSVGRIDIKENHTVVEVHDTYARKVIQALNGTSIRGRSVRADFDRPRKATTTRRPPPRRD